MEWNDFNLELYQRQILLKDIGIEGQERISGAKILVIGAGSIGCSALLYLASSGVGCGQNAESTTNLSENSKNTTKSTKARIKNNANNANKQDMSENSTTKKSSKTSTKNTAIKNQAKAQTLNNVKSTQDSKSAINDRNRQNNKNLSENSKSANSAIKNQAGNAKYKQDNKNTKKSSKNSTSANTAIKSEMLEVREVKNVKSTQSIEKTTKSTNATIKNQMQVAQSKKDLQYTLKTQNMQDLQERKNAKKIKAIQNDKNMQDTQRNAKQNTKAPKKAQKAQDTQKNTQDLQNLKDTQSSGVLGILGDANIELADISTQILYTLKDIGKSKLDVAKARLKAINPHLNIKTHKDSINFANLCKIVKNYDIVLDCTDSFAPKMLINAACVRESKILIHGGIVDFSLQILSIKPGFSACYSCVYGVSKGFLESLDSNNIESKQEKSNTPICAKSAMIGALAGILGSMQALEAIKILCDIQTPLFNNLLTFHTREMTSKNEILQRNKSCPICGNI